MQLSRNDLNVLSSYEFKSSAKQCTGRNLRSNKVVLCLKKTKKKWHLTTIDRSYLSKKNFVFRFFGLGKLAGTRLKIKDISNYLLTKDLDNLHKKDPNAYKTVHGIASRCLLYRKDGKSHIAKLWKKLSTIRCKITISEVTEHLSCPISQRPGFYTTKRAYSYYAYLPENSSMAHVVEQVDIWSRQHWITRGHKKIVISSKEQEYCKELKMLFPKFEAAYSDSATVEQLQKVDFQIPNEIFAPLPYHLKMAY